ncbi:hypothetical protein [Corynebacterium bovis]|uniref:Uncharacterized protein n=1 Tax=Corynebacterium bovis DSM 20582 = CIP 54.80 TaxID=927655 RepID=A0A8H9Y7E3_9CORY|nr:hypothetical protein [Corynebacterium bovis]MBB3116402.1 hypothetical protein [Corynebacterium bovis DSM 20582 = CIP 54.80]
MTGRKDTAPPPPNPGVGVTGVGTATVPQGDDGTDGPGKEWA